MIIGRSLAPDLPAAAAGAARAMAARCSALDAARHGRQARAMPASSLRPGEILGVAGLQGMGQLELFLACFGMTTLTTGASSASTAGR